MSTGDHSIAHRYSAKTAVYHTIFNGQWWSSRGCAMTAGRNGAGHTGNGTGRTADHNISRAALNGRRGGAR
jgi:hypothetical protein